MVRILKATSLLRFFITYLAITDVNPANIIETIAKTFHFSIINYNIFFMSSGISIFFKGGTFAPPVFPVGT